MTSEMIMLRPMRRTDFPALEELVRQAWYADDESDDNGNVPNDERGLRKYKLRKAIHLRNMHRLAAIDMHDFLSRTTEATVAERDGVVIDGQLDSLYPGRIRRFVFWVDRNLITAGNSLYPGTIASVPGHIRHNDRNVPLFHES